MKILLAIEGWEVYRVKSNPDPFVHIREQFSASHVALSTMKRKNT